MPAALTTTVGGPKRCVSSRTACSHDASSVTSVSSARPRSSISPATSSHCQPVRDADADVRALGGEPERDAAADPAPAAGDEADPVLEALPRHGAATSAGR